MLGTLLADSIIVRSNEMYAPGFQLGGIVNLSLKKIS